MADRRNVRRNRDRADPRGPQPGENINRLRGIGGRHGDGRAGGQRGGRIPAPNVPYLHLLPLDMGHYVSYLSLDEPATPAKNPAPPANNPAPPANNPAPDTERWVDSYRNLVKNLRRRVAPDRYTEGAEEDCIRIMSEGVGEDKVHSVVLYFYDEEVGENLWIALVFRIKDLYLVAFINQYHCFQFSDTDYPGFHHLLFSSNYAGLEGASESTIVRIEVGVGRLHQAVQDLRNARPGFIQKTDIGEALLGCVLMFAEAARFDNILDHIVEESEFRCGFCTLESYHYEYIKNWSKLSKVLFAARQDQEMVRIALEGGFLDKFTGPNNLPLRSIQDVESIVRVMSRQSLADSMGLFRR